MRTSTLGFILAAALALGPVPAAKAEKVPEDRLKSFADLMPKAPEGYTLQPQLGTYSSDRASSVTATYKGPDNASFIIAVTFSKDTAKQNCDIMKSTASLRMWGYDTGKIKGRDALLRKPDNANKFAAIYLVVLDDTRMVSATDPGGKADLQLVKATFEAVDFDAVAKK